LNLSTTTLDIRPHYVNMSRLQQHLFPGRQAQQQSWCTDSLLSSWSSLIQCGGSTSCQLFPGKTGGGWGSAAVLGTELYFVKLKVQVDIEGSLCAITDDIFKLLYKNIIAVHSA
jgi:hypothetical protein